MDIRLHRIPQHRRLPQIADGRKRPWLHFVSSVFVSSVFPAIASLPVFAYPKGMEVHFTPEQETQLSRIAVQAGTAPERLVTNVVSRYLDEEARFLAAVENGIAAAARGEFIEEEEMDARLEAMFKT